MTTDQPVPTRVADTRCATGEGPLWHPDEECLYWVDIPAGDLFRYDPETDTHRLVDQRAPIGGVTVEQDGALVLFGAKGRVTRWVGGETTTLIESLPEEGDSRFNDVFPDPQGRVFAGTMPTKARLGSLYRLNASTTSAHTPEVHRVETGLAIPNGMDLTPEGTAMYLTVSDERTIYRYAYDISTGELSDCETFVEVPEGEGVPDGLAVDVEGGVWSARWNGGCLIRYTPVGREDQRVELPAQKVSSVTFGGPSYTDLYITTAGGDNRATEGDGAGALFRLDAPVAGRPPFRSALSPGESATGSPQS
ncbi:SMP-30/gluconolactonase/LRE family protein [Halomarina rubra]|uniref:SMP-30/gluconolactonase/LRE family protein n=1 Tax=Halomarina rubra TaxID=2071873 RepID=A0ABD6AQZ1_9EURY|nr:SMP-30/gluconolactonase/LRE family protein [Halomarina rubra]